MAVVNRKIKNLSISNTGIPGSEPNTLFDPSVHIERQSFKANVNYVHSTTSNIVFSLMGKNILASNVEHAKNNFMKEMKKRKDNILKSPYWYMDRSGKWVQSNASNISGGENAFLDWLYNQLSPDITFNGRVSVKPLEKYKILKDQMINLMAWMRRYSELKKKDKIVTKEVINKFFRETDINGQEKVIISNMKYTNDEEDVKYSTDMVKKINVIADTMAGTVPALTDILTVVQKIANIKTTSPDKYNKIFGSYDENITYLNNWSLKSKNKTILNSIAKKDWYEVIDIDGKSFIELDVEKLALMYSMVNLTLPSNIIKDFIKDNMAVHDNYLIAQMGNFAEIFIQNFSPLNAQPIKFNTRTPYGTLGGSIRAIGNVKTGSNNTYAKTDLILSLRRRYYSQTEEKAFTIGTGQQPSVMQLKDTSGAATRATQANNKILASIQLKTTKESSLISVGNLGNAIKIGDSYGIFSMLRAQGLLLWMVNLSSVFMSDKYNIRSLQHGFTTKKIKDYISQVVYCYSVIGLLNHFNFGKSLAEAPDIIYYVGHKPYFYYNELRSRFEQLKQSSSQSNIRIGYSLSQILNIYDLGK